MKQKFIIVMLVAVVSSLFFMGQVLAADVSVQATVDRATVELGSFFQFTLTVTGTQDAEPVDFPQVEGLQARYLGPSKRISIINGQHLVSIGFMHNVYPLKTGTFQIPAISILVDGKTHTTKSISIRVVSAGSNTTLPGSGSQSEGLQDKIFVVMGTPRKETYLNEAIPLTIKLFITEFRMEHIQYPEFEHVGFLKDGEIKHKQYQQVVGGVAYNVVEFKTNIYPTRTGVLTIGPAKVTGEVVFKGSGSRRMRRFGGFFSDDFFEDFFGGYETKSVTLESVDLTVKVLPWPEEGKPESFSGAVGNFGFDVSVSPQEVTVGDPITLRMTVTGEGNFRAVKLPELDKREDLNMDFKFYDPQITSEQGMKRLEQVVIPKNDKVKEFPAVSFSYFDVDQRKYRVVTKGPFSIKVKSDGSGEIKVVGLPLTTTGQIVHQEEYLGKDIRFIRDQIGRLQPRGFQMYKSRLFAVVIGLFVLVWCGAIFAFQVSYKIKTDVRFARRMQAPRFARQGLSKAKGYMVKGEKEQFYDTVFKTLQKYFSNKFHMPAGAVTFDTVIKVVGDKGLKAGVFESLKQIFDECEMVRYAAAQLDENTMRESYKKAAEVIDAFERV
ncbi:MAG: protein BatD [Candidatus Omnitrophica bacterium]|nr:protein BatD [Candidatus Omnitrophota bacterium]